MSDRPHQVQVHTQHRYEGGANPQHRYEGGAIPQHRYEGFVTYPQHRYEGGFMNLFPEGGPSSYQVLAGIAGLLVGGTLLALAGFTLFGTLIALAVTAPLFILFSPVLIPAAIAIGLAVAGFLTSGALGLTALSSFSWVMNYIRQTQGTMPEQLDSAKRRMADMAGYVGQKTKEVGQDIQTRAQEVKAQEVKRT